MKEKTRQALTAFVEKANKLKGFALHEHISEIGLGFHVQSTGNEGLYTVDFGLPNEEKIDASLLTLRLFIQKNELFSIPQFSVLAKDGGLSLEFRSFLIETRKNYLQYLSKHPSDVKPGFFDEGEYPTNDDILRVVLYGELSHTNDSKKRQKYRTWTRDDIRKGVLLQRFARIINTLLVWIYGIAERCEKELQSAPSTSKSES